MSDYKIEKRFGIIAVRKGYITGEQLHEAMMIQLNDDLYGREHRLLGQILLARGYISPSQILEVLLSMGWPTKLLPSQFQSELGLGEQN